MWPPPTWGRFSACTNGQSTSGQSAFIRAFCAAMDRDLIGYGANPPDPKWPGGARLAVNFVLNYEEGSEPSVQDGEGFSETGLTQSTTSQAGMNGRDLAAEGMFEYGSRVGFWRLMRAFQERGLPMTVFGCAL